MSDFINYLLQHWYLIPIFIILILLTVFMWIKAIISGQKRKEEREKIIAALEKEKQKQKAAFAISSILQKGRKRS